LATAEQLARQQKLSRRKTVPQTIAASLEAFVWSRNGEAQLGLATTAGWAWSVGKIGHAFHPNWRADHFHNRVPPRSFPASRTRSNRSACSPDVAPFPLNYHVCVGRRQGHREWPQTTLTQTNCLMILWRLLAPGLWMSS